MFSDRSSLFEMKSHVLWRIIIAAIILPNRASASIDASLPLDATNHKFLQRACTSDSFDSKIEPLSPFDQSLSARRGKQDVRREDPRQPAISDMIYPRNIRNINAGGSEKLASPTGHYERHELSSRPGRNIIRRVRNILRKSNTDDRQLTRQKAPLARRKSP